MMAGEKEQQRSAPSVQPGGRAPAPGALGLVQDFINTHYDLEVDHGAELLTSPESLASWLASRGLTTAQVRAVESEHAHALAAREALRGLARAHGTGADARDQALAELCRAARGAPVEVAFGPQGPYFLSADGGVPGAIGVLMAITAQSMIDGTWSRLKVCPGHDCGWAFYDHSRNQAGRWCSMSVCGGRAKARAHYRRRRGGGE